MEPFLKQFCAPKFYMYKVFIILLLVKKISNEKRYPFEFNSPVARTSRAQSLMLSETQARRFLVNYLKCF